MTDNLAPWEREFLEREAAGQAEAASVAHHEAIVLRAAARIIRRRSKRPGSLMVGVLVRVLRTLADRIEEANGDRA